MKLVLATQNQDKIREIKAALRGLDVQILTLPKIKGSKLRESGQTLEENALQKALSTFKITGLASLSDDSGLEVEYLNRAPGVRSSRFAGNRATYLDNNLKLLRKLNGVSLEQRKAKFRCVLALVISEKRIYLTEGKISGLIAKEMRGKKGFGYDPVFYVKRFHKTLAQLSLEQKNRISHRGKALSKLRRFLSRLAQRNGLT